ncbi:MAG: retropepsin-like aspartic protease [Planctomycetota bacterium]|jgi:hypothetical protein
MRKKKRKLLLWALVIACLILSALIHIGSKQVTEVFVEVENLESTPGITLMDPNAGGIEIVKVNDNNDIKVNWGPVGIHLNDTGKCRVKQVGTFNVQVRGRLPNGNEYPVVIDSGNAAPMAVVTTVVLENALPVLPFKQLPKGQGGFSQIGELKIGDMKIVNAPCTYWTGHYERRFLGWTTWKQKDINLGLGLMQSFVYILIDNVSQEVEFSVEHFVAEPNQVWASYPMIVETREHGNKRLTVDIPIAGQGTHLMLDTGAGPGLILTEKIWARISEGLQIVSTVKSFVSSPADGQVPCNEVVVRELGVGEAVIPNAVVFVMPDENPYGEDDFTLGMGFFKDTMIVLDFGNDLLWIKKPG